MRPTKPLRPLERDIQAAGIAVARAMGCIVHINGVHSGGATRRSGLGVGSPDTLVLIPPLQVALFVEWKRDHREHPTEAQRAWHDRHRALGGHVTVCWSVQQMVDAIHAVKVETARRVARTAPSMPLRVRLGADEAETPRDSDRPHATNPSREIVPTSAQGGHAGIPERVPL